MYGINIEDVDGLIYVVTLKWLNPIVFLHQIYHATFKSMTTNNVSAYFRLGLHPISIVGLYYPISDLNIIRGW